MIRAALPDANVPTSVRSTGVPVTRGAVSDLDTVLAEWLAEHADGTTCVIGQAPAVTPAGLPALPASARVRSLTPELAKGLEFDFVVLLAPGTWGGGVAGAVDRYVAMTRATQRLVVLT